MNALKIFAGLAQLAERDLAKVEVVSSNLIARLKMGSIPKVVE